MYPHERSLVKNLNGKPFTIIGVNSDSSPEIPRKLVEDGTVTWRSFQNDGPEVSISETWMVTGWPTIYVLDSEGRIRFKNVRGDELDAAIRTLMEEMNEEWPEFVHEEEAEKSEDGPDSEPEKNRSSDDEDDKSPR